jgi:predicted DsbA family dithiol-disulfide isomerase
MRRLLLYHDFASPFCRLAVAIAREVVGSDSASLELVPLELYPDGAAPLTPGDLIHDEVQAAQELARSCQVELVTPPLLPRTGKAHEAVLYARAQERAVAMASAIYDALWARGLDIGRIDVLADLGADVGLDRDALHVELGLDVHRAAVERTQQLVAGAGIESVPTYQVGQIRTAGLMPAAELRSWMESAGV